MPTPTRKRRHEAVDDTLSSIACQSCRLRKTKCDGAFPSCSYCTKAEVACIILDPTASRPYTREEVRGLEEKVQALQSLLSVRTTASDKVTGPLPNVKPNTLDAAVAHQPRSHRTRPTPRYVGIEEGTVFSRFIAHAIRKHCSRLTLKKLFVPNVSAHYIEHHPPHNLPPRQQAIELFACYLSDFHLEQPFLNVQHIWETIDKFCIDGRDMSTRPDSLSPAQRQDIFQLNIALALESVRPFRLGSFPLHPFGFFTAALQGLAPLGFSFDRLQDIEAFLLIANFGLYFHIGCSIWELSQLCIRMCIEQGLHKNSTYFSGHRNLHEERRRRIFWECYRLDRVSSSTLGRPFGVDDSDIDIEAPGDESSTMQQSDEGPLDSIANRLLIHNSDDTVFNHFLRLCRITSSVHDSLYFSHFQPAISSNASQGAVSNAKSETLLKPGEVYSLFSTFDHQLDEWRSSAPASPHPDSVYQMAEYWELCYHKERLFLLRMVIDRIPSNDNPPSDILLRLCTDSAASVVQNYDYLRQQNCVTYTRSFTRLIFSAGLVLVYSAFTHLVAHREPVTSPSQVDVATWWRPAGTRPPRSLAYGQVLVALSTTKDLLFWFADKMPDMLVFAQFFEALQQDLPPEPQSTDTTASGVRPDAIERLSWAIDPLHPQADHMAGSAWPETAAGISTGMEAGPSGQGDFNDGVSASQRHDNAIDISRDALFEPNISNWFASDTPGLDMGYSVFFQPSSWPFFSNVPGMDEVEAALTGFEWETTIPWNTPTDDQG